MISAQWIYLGMALGLTQESLMDIRAMKPADSQYFLSMMFMQWLQHTVGYCTVCHVCDRFVSGLPSGNSKSALSWRGVHVTSVIGTRLTM